jgi:ppGpp synthetase/RelA/SpoT-type nucleotidyltranferase
MYDHYEQLAKFAADLIEERISVENDDNSDFKLDAKVSHRAKSPTSLREKLKMRDEEKHYQSHKEIRNDIVDLAGARIILYMPSQEQRDGAERIIREIWPKAERKSHEGSRHRLEDLQSEEEGNKSQQLKKHRRLHLGYRAIHYRVQMLKDQAPKNGPYRWKSYDKVEIQIISALSHAWAEAGHEVQYKSWAYGEPTLQEERILDALNGLVQSGDLLLEQFHDLVKERTFSPIEYVDRLEAYLRGLDVLHGPKVLKEHFKGGLEVLLEFLKAKRMNNPFRVRNAIKKLGFPDAPRLNEIMNTFQPPFMPHKDMIATICLIVDVIRKKRAELKHNDDSQQGQEYHERSSTGSSTEEEDNDEYRDDENDDENKANQDEDDMGGIGDDGQKRKRIVAAGEGGGKQGEEEEEEKDDDDDDNDDGIDESEDSESSHESSHRAENVELVKPSTRCRILMLALILLYHFAGNSDATNSFLQQQADQMTMKQKRSINWVIVSPERREALLEERIESERNESKIKKKIKPVWNWFQEQATVRSSFPGLVFKLAKMGVVRDDGLVLLMDRLKAIATVR